MYGLQATFASQGAMSTTMDEALAAHEALLVLRSLRSPRPSRGRVRWRTDHVHHDGRNPWSRRTN